MAAKIYTVNQGHTLVMPGGQTLSGGEDVKLDNDLAERHADRVTLKAKPAKATPAPADSAEKPATLKD